MIYLQSLVLNNAIYLVLSNSPLCFINLIAFIEFYLRFHAQNNYSCYNYTEANMQSNN